MTSTTDARPLPAPRGVLRALPRPFPDEPDATYRRTMLRQRRGSLRTAAIVAVVGPAMSLPIHLVVGAPLATLAYAALAAAAMLVILVAVNHVPSGWLWLVATCFGLVGIIAIGAATIVEPTSLGTYAVGIIGMLPIGVAVFATWSAAAQVRWTLVGGLVLAAGLTIEPIASAAAPVAPALAGGFAIGSAFAIAAAIQFENARIRLHRSLRLVHERRAELVAVSRLAARSVVQLRAVEAVGITLNEQGATPAALDAVVGILFEEFGYSHPSIYVGDATRVMLGAQRGYANPVHEIAAGKGVIGRALTSGTVELVRDVALDPDYRSECDAVVSEIAVPLRFDGRLSGVLNVEGVHPIEPADVASIMVVADRVAAALELAERRHTLEAILDGAPLAIVAYDANHVVRFWGDGAERVFGWAAAEVEGRVSPLVETIDTASDPAYRGIVAGERVEGIEAERLTRDGTHVPVRIFAAPLRGRPGSGHVVVYQDLTSEHRTASALAESEARYQSLVASLHEGVVLHDVNGVVVASNPAAEAMLGLTLDEMIESTAHGEPWHAIHEDGTDVARADHPASVVLATGEPVLGVVMGVRTMDGGEPTWLSIDAVPLDPGASPPGGVVVSFNDITDRQRLQADLLQSQKMDSVGRLAGGIAHDFNNLLTAILGNGQMLAEIVDGVAAEHVTEIQRAAERAAELTRQLLGFARKTYLDPGDHELNAIVADMEPMIRRLVGAHIAVVTKLDPTVGHVRVDRSQMDQVLLNLAVNARDAMADGGIMSIETATLDRGGLEPTIGVDADRVAVMRVRDTGVGMNEDVRRHAFDPFYTTKPRGRGTGLGLATTHGIIMQSGGAITVDSMPGDGSTFAVYLPEVQPGVAVPVVVDARLRHSGGQTLLLVEDEEAVRNVARRILEHAGYRVLHAPNANAAMSLISNGLDEIDLLVSDVVMPGMRGPEMYELLRERRPDLPAVFLSGYADLADATGALPHGSRFLAKPYTPADLLRVVQQSLLDPAA